MVKLVVLDGFTLNPGDLSWDGFKELANVAYFDRTPAEQTLERIGTAEAVLSNKVVIDKHIIANAPNLKYIGVLATGYNVIDVAAARQKGIVVTNIPSYSTNSVAQLVFAHIFAHYNRVEHHNQYVKDGGWCRSLYDSFFISPQTEIAGKTMGIVGYGNIGQRIAQIALAFDMKVLINNRSQKLGLPVGVTQVALNEVFSQSDVVSINCPLTETNRSFVNRQLLSLMKPKAILVNTGRGQLIHEADLVEALNDGQIAGASLDVLALEPPSVDNPLLHAKNCILTPHMAWATFEARSRLMKTALENFKAFMSGAPTNEVQ